MLLRSRLYLWVVITSSLFDSRSLCLHFQQLYLCIPTMGWRSLGSIRRKGWLQHTPKRPPVCIPSSDNTELIAANKLTILGRVTNPLLKNTRVVINFLPQVWGLEGRVEERHMRLEKFQFCFRSEYDLQVVLSKGPYHYALAKMGTHSFRVFPEHYLFLDPYPWYSSSLLQ